ncbi:MAG TPA: cytochrome c [Terriglobales bacterium]|nr:cytochrome c [Terriglobales bacterium]
MKPALWSVAAALLGFALITIVSSSAAPASAANVARGKYLVERVALCGDCHSAHNDKGGPVPGRELRGAPLTFKPVTPQPNWADSAPNIAGLRGWDDEDAVKFLTTGLAYNDLPARPPMPQYHMSKEDAEAVVAYLKSLSPMAK